MPNHSDCPEFIELVALTAAGTLARCTGLTPDEAGQAAVAVAQDIQALFAGQSVYVPKGTNWQKLRRNLDIWRAYQTGELSQTELGLRHGLSQGRIAQILGEFQGPHPHRPE